MNSAVKLEAVPLPDGINGLSSREAAVLLEHGRNILVPESTGQRWLRWIGPLRDPMVLLLLIATPTYFSIGDRLDGMATLVALLPIVAVGWVLEGRAQRTLDKLRVMVAPMSAVVRDGALIAIPAEELVVNDVILIREGDVLPADCAIRRDAHVIVDESSVTGESLPITKRKGDEVLAGTTVTSGQCFVEVVRTGSSTTYGGMSGLIARTKQPRTPLQIAIARLVRSMAIGAVLFAAMVGLSEYFRNQSWATAVIAGVSLLIAAIPEEFSIVYSLYLSLGAWRMSRESALIRNLPGVETLGSVTVICSDKTGTLTEGTLEISVLEPIGVPEAELLSTAVMACAVNPFDPMDRAIVEAAAQASVDVDALHSRELVHSWPFDSKNNYMTQEWRTDAGIVIAAKGAFDNLTTIASSDDSVLAAVHDVMTQGGTRVIAVARRVVTEASGDREIDERELHIIGLIGFSDPARPEARQAIADAYAAGIRVVMITGDHPATATAIARDLGIKHRDGTEAHVRIGEDIASASAADLDDIVHSTDVFARTRPEQKHLLVESLRRQGEVVAMTGDGVNDAAALRAAHIGIAMGRRGTEVAREAATMVLLDDNFATIVSATRNGRRIYDNLTRAFAYLIAVHMPLVLIALIVPLTGLPLLLVPMQLIVLEVLLHPIVSLVFQAEPADADVMTRPPRPSNYAMTWRTLWRPLVLGVSISAAIILMYALVLDWGWAEQQARGFGFVMLLAAQPLMILVTRAGEVRLWRFRSRITREFVGAMIAVVLTVLAVVATDFGQLVKADAFPAIGWPMLLATAAIACLWPEFTKPLRRALP